MEHLEHGLGRYKYVVQVNLAVCSLGFFARNHEDFSVADVGDGLI